MSMYSWIPNATFPSASNWRSLSLCSLASSSFSRICFAFSLRSVTLHPMASPGRRPHSGILFLVNVLIGSTPVMLLSRLTPFSRRGTSFPAPIFRVIFSIRMVLMGFILGAQFYGRFFFSDHKGVFLQGLVHVPFPAFVPDLVPMDVFYLSHVPNMLPSDEVDEHILSEREMLFDFLLRDFEDKRVSDTMGGFVDLKRSSVDEMDLVPSLVAAFSGDLAGFQAGFFLVDGDRVKVAFLIEEDAEFLLDVRKRNHVHQPCREADIFPSHPVDQHVPFLEDFPYLIGGVGKFQQVPQDDVEGHAHGQGMGAVVRPADEGMQFPPYFPGLRRGDSFEMVFCHFAFGGFLRFPRSRTPDRFLSSMLNSVIIRLEG